jgi:hypothetical protein
MSATNAQQSQYQLKKFLSAEKIYMEQAKWFAGEHRKNDPGEQFLTIWVENYGNVFRLMWNLSKCRTCQFGEKCGYKLEVSCEDFQKDKEE